MIYLDTSAAARLIRVEDESRALAVFLAERLNTPLASSTLLYPELVRAISRTRPELAPRAVALIRRMMTVPMVGDIVEHAATIGNPGLRTLDALHLATAASLASELQAFVTYDKRLADAAIEIGLPVEAPS